MCQLATAAGTSQRTPAACSTAVFRIQPAGSLMPMPLPAPSMIRMWHMLLPHDRVLPFAGRSCWPHSPSCTPAGAATPGPPPAPSTPSYPTSQPSRRRRPQPQPAASSPQVPNNICLRFGSFPLAEQNHVRSCSGNWAASRSQLGSAGQLLHAKISVLIVHRCCRRHGFSTGHHRRRCRPSADRRLRQRSGGRRSGCRAAAGAAGLRRRRGQGLGGGCGAPHRRQASFGQECAP